MAKVKKVYSCYYCRQLMPKGELVLINVADKKDKFGFFLEQKELVCRPCQRWCEIGAGIETMDW